MRAAYEEELSFMQRMQQLEIDRVKRLAEIESLKQKKTIEAIGRDTIVQMASAGPDTQAKLLKGLGLQGFMIMDGKKPINLMGTANGMLGQMGQMTMNQR